MPLMTNLLRHPETGVYWYRKTIPPELRPILGKREIKRTLKTKDSSRARVEAAKVAVEVNKLIEDARAGRLRRYEELDLDHLAFRWFQDFARELRAYQRYLEEEPQTGHLYVPWEGEVMRPIRDEHEMDESLKDWLRKNEIEVNPDGQDFAVLRGFAADRHFEEYPPERRLADITDRTRDGGSVVEKSGPNGMRLSQLWDAWAAEAKPPGKTVAEWKTVMRRLQEILGGDVPVRSVTKKQMIDFKDTLMKLPSRTGKGFKGKTVKEIIEGTQGKEIQRITNDSVNKDMNLVAALFAWGERNGKLDANPAKGVKAKVKKIKNRRLPYDRDDIAKLFRLPIYQGQPQWTARYWLPLLGAWTGARLEELGQLRTADVREQEGISFLSIDQIENEASIKTEASRRNVPVHSKLIELGFIKYVELRRNARKAQLFDLRRDGRDKYTAAFSTWWGRAARKVVPDTRKTFHSFRHLFKDRCRAAALDEEIHDRLTGHAGRKTEGRGYGSGHDLVALHEAMKRITIPGFPL